MKDDSGKLRRLFTCMNCSGETVFDEMSNLFKCTYCGAVQIIDVNNVTTDFCLQNLMKKNHLTTLVTSQYVLSKKYFQDDLMACLSNVEDSLGQEYYDRYMALDDSNRRIYEVNEELSNIEARSADNAKNRDKYGEIFLKYEDFKKLIIVLVAFVVVTAFAFFMFRFGTTAFLIALTPILIPLIYIFVHSEEMNGAIKNGIVSKSEYLEAKKQLSAIKKDNENNSNETHKLKKDLVILQEENKRIATRLKELERAILDDRCEV